MPTYIQYYTWKKAGADTVKDQLKRTPFGKELYKSSLLQLCKVRYIVSINEAPDDETMAAASLKLISRDL